MRCARFAKPTFVVVGEEDQTHVSPAGALASALPRVQFRRVPGDHWTALTGADFETAMVSFLTHIPGIHSP
jgi:pimeloyl-ACP methyl ester carboxylesterase